MAIRKTPYEEENFVDSTKPVWNYSLFDEEEIRNFQNGTNYNLYKFFGSHPKKVLDKEGFYFSVWAPNATYISVVGDFNKWDTGAHPLFVRLDHSGIWEGFIPGIKEFENYKYFIIGYEGVELYKGDPYANHWELRPATSSKTKNVQYEWNDTTWMDKRKKYNSLHSPWSIYEVHLGSWMKPNPYDEDSFNSYDQISELLVPYVKEMGFTHVELMPVMEFPFDGSWGYQGCGYFAPTSRFGIPEDFMRLVEAFHNEDIGVILDWVPSHFPNDAHGLFKFDGTHTYEYADMRKGFHPDWNSYIFNYRRGEVRSFLISNARYWFEMYHIDAMRVDAVSSMLRLDYSREEGEWEENEYGGNGNIEAMAFIKNLNEMVYRDFPDVQMIAEEATDWPSVTGLTTTGGLGFGMKWMMGWMHDTLDYFKVDPLYRKDFQNQFTFSMAYFYNDNFVLPLSHDETVHGKSPMIYKMPGDEWQKFANLRVLYSYMYTHPGGKLLFMGNEFGQTSEWNYKTELDWNLLRYEPHSKLKTFFKDLNNLFTSNPAFYELQFDRKGFEWVDLDHRNECVMAYMRKGKKRKDDLLVIFNMTPVERYDWKITVYEKITWKQIFCSDDAKYWGTGKFSNQEINTTVVDKKNNVAEIKLNLPALSAIVLQ
ncbi:MAG: 1,4-alpha-glucan branching protein GlgB [Bacteroidota bacterium]|nr:1,4-alpha-glucan branching protein GlgB [Bacteroidota bacterium]